MEDKGQAPQNRNLEEVGTPWDVACCGRGLPEKKEARTRTAAIDLKGPAGSTAESFLPSDYISPGAGATLSHHSE